MAAPTAPVRLLCDEPALPGLLWAMRFDESGCGHLVGRDEDLTAPGRFGEGFTWLHFNLNDARLADLVAEGRLGPRYLTAAAFASDPHQRLMVEDGHIGGVVADLVREAGEPTKVDAGGRLHFVMGSRLLASGRRHPVVGPDLARDAAAGGAEHPRTCPAARRHRRPCGDRDGQDRRSPGRRTRRDRGPHPRRAGAR